MTLTEKLGKTVSYNSWHPRRSRLGHST